MARSCDDPGLVIREPIGDCLLQAFNYYVDDDYRLDSLTNITRFDVVRFYRSIFPQKRDKDPTLYESAIAELVKGERSSPRFSSDAHIVSRVATLPRLPIDDSGFSLAHFQNVTRTSFGPKRSTSSGPSFI